MNHQTESQKITKKVSNLTVLDFLIRTDKTDVAKIWILFKVKKFACSTMWSIKINQLIR